MNKLILLSLILVTLVGGCTFKIEAPKSQGQPISNQSRQINQPKIEMSPAVAPPKTVSITREEWLRLHGCQDIAKSEYKNGDFKVSWVENGTEYVGQILLRGNAGEMRVRLNEDSYVDQTFDYKKCSSGYWFVGYAPVDAVTGNSIEKFDDFNENFKFSYSPTGELYVERCSDTDQCVKAKIEMWKND